jgi:hypothetical protein
MVVTPAAASGLLFFFGFRTTGLAMVLLERCI